jgi:taurine transport system substrate-binding protein
VYLYYIEWGGTTCIVSNNSGISKNNAKKLEGKKVAVPLGTMAEYIFDQTMTFTHSR